MKSVITKTWKVLRDLQQKAEKLFGYRADEVIGKERVSVFPRRDRPAECAGMAGAGSQEGEYIAKTKFIRKDGSAFNARIQVTTFEMAYQRQTGYCGVTRLLKKVEVPIKLDNQVNPVLNITRLGSFISAWRCPPLSEGLTPPPC